MISRETRAGHAGGAKIAVWISEEMMSLLPRNIYGVTKLSAEHQCRLFHELHDLPVIVLRTSRFFPRTTTWPTQLLNQSPTPRPGVAIILQRPLGDIRDEEIVDRMTIGQ